MDKKFDRQCPGDDPTKKAIPELYGCPECSSDIEIWSDESKGKCTACSKVFQKDQLKKKD